MDKGDKGYKKRLQMKGCNIVGDRHTDTDF